jgi:hypothetical protein
MVVLIVSEDNLLAAESTAFVAFAKLDHYSVRYFI